MLSIYIAYAKHILNLYIVLVLYKVGYAIILIYI